MSVVQLRAIRLTYRVEHRRRDSSTMREFRERAHSLDGLEQAVRPYPDPKAALDSARVELLSDELRPLTLASGASMTIGRSEAPRDRAGRD